MFDLKIGFLGCPSIPDVPWNQENVRKLGALGFNALQLNIAWGARPGDEPLNLEDVVDPQRLPAGCAQSLPLRSDSDPDAVTLRRDNLHQRIALCRQANMRAIFHFGAPYNMHARFGDSPPNCLLDEDVQTLYVELLKAFAAQFPGVDDLWLYTYDQDAWLCSEFGECPTCRGVPLHERVSTFVNRLARTWHQLSDGGRVWWEPWELSAGQVLRSIERLDPGCVGLALHSNIAEVMVTMPVDRWLRNSVHLAHARELPVVVEHFLGGPTEEVEPFGHLSWPLVTWRALRAIADLHVEGIKEYYGLVPTREDANLRMTGLYLTHPELDADAALAELAKPYGTCADGVARYWRLTSEAMDLFPWNTSWFIREVGKCDPAHSMDAAFIRGQQCHTPSWDSTRRAIFMKTDSATPDPWLLEDVQLQCELAAEVQARAIALGEDLAARIPTSLAADWQAGLIELRAWRQRTLSYAYHLRETNLTTILRQCLQQGYNVAPRLLAELAAVLRADRENQGQPEPCSSALALLQSDPKEFVETYFVDTGVDEVSRGHFTVTSR